MGEFDLFSAGVRLFGLYCIGRGLLDLLYALLTELNIYPHSVTKIDHAVNEWVLGFIFLLIGLYFLRGAPLLMDYAFPRKGNDNSGDESDSPDGDNRTE